MQKELKALQGTWKAVALEAGGTALPRESDPDFLFIVGAEGKATGRMGKIEYQARMSVDPTKDPKTIDNAHETGQDRGKKQFGIYKVEAGKWIVCMTGPGAAEGDRPKTFDTKDTFRDLIAAVHNADLTCRAQILAPGQNPGMEKILDAFERRTGRAVMLNTSFNLHGFPIVRTAKEALHVFASSGLEHMQVGEYLVRKAR